MFQLSLLAGTMSSDVEMDSAYQTTGCVINKMIVKTCLMSSIAVSRRARLWCFDALSKPLSEEYQDDCFILGDMKANLVAVLFAAPICL